MTSNNSPFINLIAWYPHSGCRWLNRSLLAKHSKLACNEFFLPWLSHTTDMTLDLDRTSQVHKSRSLPELAKVFKVVQQATTHGRIEGIKEYIRLCLQDLTPEGKHFVGALSPGAPQPLEPDLGALLKAYSNIRIIHLVRHPLDCFVSMQSRAELDANPIKIASTWLSYNITLRAYQEQLGSNYKLLRYEDLKENTEEALVDLCTWMGIEFEDQMLEGLSVYHGKNQGKSERAKELMSSRAYQDFKEIVESECKNYKYTL